MLSTSNLNLGKYILILFLLSCTHEGTRQSPYPSNPDFSKDNGDPIDSLTTYFPDTITFNSNLEAEYYSNVLRSAKEPILFNYYQGHSIYRLLWLRAFDPPMVYSIHNNQGFIWMEIKMPSKVRRLDGTDVQYNNPDLNITIKLSMKEWSYFESLLDKSKFWEMATFDNMHGVDGSDWVMEAHLEDKYKVVARWSPKGNFRRCGEYLISLRGSVKEVY